jgi:hypothetical protein
MGDATGLVAAGGYCGVTRHTGTGGKVTSAHTGEIFFNIFLKLFSNLTMFNFYFPNF